MWLARGTTLRWHDCCARTRRQPVPSLAASNSRSTRRSTILGRSCSTSATRARTPSKPTGGRRTSRTLSSSRSCRSFRSVLGHVWNRCPPNFTERTLGETRCQGKVRKAEADVRAPVADGEAYRGKETCPAMHPRYHGEVYTEGIQRE